MEAIKNIPLISVIVPIYKTEKYICKCIESIINQTYKNLEIILVDDDSPDDCGNICDRYAQRDKRIKVIHKKNEGAAIARNIGINIATGEYVSFVDSDDWIDLDLYERLLKKIKSDDDMIIFGLRYVNPNNYKINELSFENVKFEVNDENVNRLFNLIKTGGIGYTCNKIYRRENIKNVEFEKIRICEDLCFSLKVLNKVKYIRCVDVIGYNYLQHTESVLHKSDIENLLSLDKLDEILSLNLKIINKENSSYIYNMIMKVNLSDIIIRDIMKNKQLDKISRQNFIKNIFYYKSIVKKLKVDFNDNKMVFIMVI